ncbi:MAG TPA: histidinol-phosphate transaminase [Bacteroidales bacterium]|nr:histidinol-phosphate transaminase [Bacteroidales bacterium]
MEELEKLIRPNVRRLTPYSCARDDFKGKEGVFLDANENPYGSLNRYPDPYQCELKSAISKIKGIPADKIFLGNGSDEIIDLCFRIFCTPGVDKALTFTPTYGMYQVSASANDVDLIKVPLDEEFNIRYSDLQPWPDYRNLKLIIVCSPNNPTGNNMSRHELDKLITGFHGIVLLDEAYNDFTGEPSFIENLDKYPNLIVMQTFSKAWAMASVRVGMAFASASIIRYFNKMKPPYNISTLNQKSVLKKLSSQLAVRKRINTIVAERDRISAELKKIPVVLNVYRSDANFILVRTADADDIYNYLVSCGIIVRNRNSVVENCLRITVGTRSENNRMLKALKSFIL